MDRLDAPASGTAVSVWVELTFVVRVHRDRRRERDHIDSVYVFGPPSSSGQLVAPT